MNENLRVKIEQLPDSPGCYLMRSHGNIIYIGKAVNLKNRVRQYFRTSTYHTPKVQAMVDHVDDFDIVLVDNELEALILECNLIKLHRPFYNILLKDDKQYPYIRMDLREDFPKAELFRRPEKDGATYFGPYIGTTVVREVLNILREEFPLRTCAQLPKKNASRACVHAMTGRCLAPCTGNVTPEEYKVHAQKVADFLAGNDAGLVERLTEKMKEASKALEFEKAAAYRDKLIAVQELLEKQKASNMRGDDYDVLACAPEGSDMLVQALFMRGGKLIGSEVFVMENGEGTEDGELLTEFMLQYYDGDHRIPPMILVENVTEETAILENLLREKRGGAVEIRMPQRGEKRRMMDMAQKNVLDAVKKRFAQLKRSYERTTGALEELRDVLGLESTPHRIEGFDISNTQGAQSVASMVVSVDGVAARKEYRLFRIKTVEGPNDFASMHEVISRRFRHGLEELEEGASPEEGKFTRMPDVVLIDGGPEQLRCALEAAAEVGVNIPMFGLAERIDEIYLPGQEETIYLDRHSPALHLIERLRDEAHRFAITNHRKMRDKHSIASRLDTVSGIGAKRKTALLRAFRSVEAMKNASVEALAAVDGMTQKAAEAVWNELHSDK